MGGLAAHFSVSGARSFTCFHTLATLSRNEKEVGISGCYQSVIMESRSSQCSQHRLDKEMTPLWSCSSAASHRRLNERMCACRYLFGTSLCMGVATGLGIAFLMKRLEGQGVHQVRGCCVQRWWCELRQCVHCLLGLGWRDRCCCMGCNA